MPGTSLSPVTGADPQKLAAAQATFHEKVALFEASVADVRDAVVEVNITWFGNTNKQFNTYENLWTENMQKYNNGVRIVGDALGDVGTGYTVLDAGTAGTGA